MLQVKADTLHGAAKLGDAEAAEKLLAEGADVDQKDARGITALGVAVGFNKLPVIKALVKAGANVKLTDSKGHTPLHYAAGALTRGASCDRTLPALQPLYWQTLRRCFIHPGLAVL